jgi:hypothetical protein
LSYWIKTYGIPQALCCDHKNAFVLTREPTDAELPAGITKPKSHFGRACAKPGVEVIAANSPQAKGRVERNCGLDQDRLVKELRLAGISTIREANRFLLETCLPKMNGKFARPAASREDARVPLLGVNLTDIFCFEYGRTVSNDCTVRFETGLFRLLKEWGWVRGISPLPKKPVTVRRKLDGTICILRDGKPRDAIPLKFIEILFKKEANWQASDAA